MAGVNGRADIVGPPISLGDFLPERREVIINSQSYLAWVTTGKRYPRSIMAKLDKTARIYNNKIAPLLDDQAPDNLRLDAAESQPEAWQQYVTDAVMLLVPDLLESEVELIDLEILEDLLKQLGYFKDIPDEAGIQSTEDKDVVVPLTGDTSPPDSADFTQATPSISS